MPPRSSPSSPLPPACVGEPLTRRRFVALGLAATLLPRALRAAVPAAGATLYFYSPESNINNFGTLKGEFDAYFAGLGGHKFQPFSDRATFEAALKENRPGLYFLSSWHYAQFSDRARLQPLLVGALREKNTQRHVLCVKRSGADPGVRPNSTVASAGKRDFTRDLLGQMLSVAQLSALPTIKLLEVPKDIDALMAVNFGAATAAIATEVGLERLKNTNGRQYEQLTPPLATGPERLLPIIVSIGTPDPNATDLVTILTAMGSTDEGRQRVRLLGLDAWNPISIAQQEALRP